MLSSGRHLPPWSAVVLVVALVVTTAAGLPGRGQTDWSDCHRQGMTSATLLLQHQQQQEEVQGGMGMTPATTHNTISSNSSRVVAARVRHVCSGS